MKNKLSAICLLLAYLVHMCGCASNSNAVSREEYDKVVAELNELKAQSSSDQPESENAGSQTDNGKDQASGFDEQTALSQLNVQEYSYSNQYNHFDFLVIENNSKWNLRINAELQTFDSSGNILSVKNDSKSAVEHGTTTIIPFSLDEEYAKTEYALSLSEEKAYSSVVSNLSYTNNPSTNKEIISVTNNGDVDVYYACAYVLFFKGDTVVDWDYSYFINDDNTLKPGETKSRELDCYEDYDSFKIFLTGRGK